MHTFNRMVLAMAFMGVSVVVQAADRDYPGPFYGKAGDRNAKPTPDKALAGTWLNHEYAGLGAFQLRHNGQLKVGKVTLSEHNLATRQPLAFGVPAQVSPTYRVRA